MRAPPFQHWTRQRERGNRFMLSLLAWLALTLGRRFIRLLLYPIVTYYLLTAPAARLASRQFLRRALSREPGWLNIGRHFYTFALVSVDRLFFLSGRGGKFQVDIEGSEVFDHCVSAQRGCLLLVSHFGSFDAMRAAGGHLPIRLLMDKAHNPRVMALLESLDPQLADSVLDAATAPAALALELDERLRRGDWIGIMADRAGPRERVVHCDFLGDRAPLPAGPWLLAMALKVPVILCVGVFTGGNRYSVHFERVDARTTEGAEPMTPRKVPRRERERMLVKQMRHYAARLEYYTRLSPYNWFNFYDFWADETVTDH